MDKEKYQPLVVNLNSIPNEGCKIIIYNDFPIAIFRRGKEVYAIDNRCPHRGGSLGNGEINDGTVTCPLHQWKFNIASGICVQNNKISTDCYLVEVNSETVKINIL